MRRGEGKKEKGRKGKEGKEGKLFGEEGERLSKKR